MTASPVREARPFRNNGAQAVRIPADREMLGERVVIRRDGERLILEPQRARGLLSLLPSWEPLDETLPEPDDPILASEGMLRRATCSTRTSCPISSATLPGLPRIVRRS